MPSKSTLAAPASCNHATATLQSIMHCRLLCISQLVDACCQRLWVQEQQTWQHYLPLLEALQEEAHALVGVGGGSPDQLGLRPLQCHTLPCNTAQLTKAHQNCRKALSALGSGNLPIRHTFPPPSNPQFCSDTYANARGQD